MILSRGPRRPLPEKWTANNYNGIYLLAMIGFSEERMSEEIGIPVSAFRNMRDNDPAFREALFNGKTRATMEVMSAMHQNCIDRYVDEWETHVIKGELKTIKVKKFHKANPWLQAKWMSLKEREQWAEKHPQGIDNSTTNVNYDIKVLSIEDLEMLKRLQKSKEIAQDAGTIEHTDS